MSEEYFDKCLCWWFKHITDRPTKPTPVVKTHFYMDTDKYEPLSKEVYDNKKEERINTRFRKFFWQWSHICILGPVFCVILGFHYILIT